jgi:hypothetical protein
MPDTMRAPVKEAVEKALKLDDEDLEEAAGFVAELDRRAAEMEAGTVRGIPWEELWAGFQRERGGS